MKMSMNPTSLLIRRFGVALFLVSQLNRLFSRMIILSGCPCSRVPSHCFFLQALFRGLSFVQLNRLKTLSLFSGGVLAVGRRVPSHVYDAPSALLWPEALSQVFVGAELPVLLVPVGHLHHPQHLPYRVGKEGAYDEDAGQRHKGQAQDMRGHLHVLHEGVEPLPGLEGVVQDDHGDAGRDEEAAEGRTHHAQLRLGEAAPSGLLLQAAGDHVLGREGASVAGSVHSLSRASAKKNITH